MLATIPWASDLLATTNAHAERIAVHDGERGITFRELAGRAARIAHLLRERGIQPGQPVATSLRNGIPAVWTGVGLRLAGVAETALSAGYTEAERRHALTLSGARLVLTTRSEAASFRDLGCDAVTIEDIPEAPGDLTTLPPVPGEAWARIGFTSGTTGAPKAII
ncbi:MAG TPA: AMP-binding protein, partial [Acetobacteraceae bacterium]|nr:AMP-binding protein [Acetobacteraceae bacterium]